MLEVSGLRKAFGGVEAVAGVSFALGAGAVLALIGPNGAGKSTCFDLVAGRLRPDAGSVRVGGREVAGRGARAARAAGVGRGFQVAAVFGSMTARENAQLALLAAGGEAWGGWRPLAGRRVAEAEALLAEAGLAALADVPAGLLAHGDRKRLDLALALAGRPRLLLLDEPTAGLAAPERAALMALVRRLAAGRGVAVLFTEHDMDVVFGAADRILVLDRGRVIAEGDAAAIRADRSVRAVYLGPDTSAGTSPGTSPGDGPAAADPLPARAPPPPSAVPLLAVEGLAVGYGRVPVVRDLSLAVGRGEVLVLVGRNGAGKTTTLRGLMGLAPPSAGRVRFDGRDLAGLPPHRIARAGIGYVPEERRVFADLTVSENLEVGRRPSAPDLAPWTPERLFALFPALGALRRRRAGWMSGGEQQMLAVARTLMGNPRLVLLDEPGEGLSPLVAGRMAEAVAALKAEGLAVVLAEQGLPFARRVADRAVVLETGRAAWSGTLAALLADEPARRRHLAV